MKCPYCGNEMSEGYIPVSDIILQWLPAESKPPFVLTMIGKNGIALSGLPFISYIKVPSYYCENCKIVITPVTDK